VKPVTWTPVDSRVDSGASMSAYLRRQAAAANLQLQKIKSHRILSSIAPAASSTSRVASSSPSRAFHSSVAAGLVRHPHNNLGEDVAPHTTTSRRTHRGPSTNRSGTSKHRQQAQLEGMKNNTTRTGHNDHTRH
jgi:hypothetical protein